MPRRRRAHAPSPCGVPSRRADAGRASRSTWWSRARPSAPATSRCSRSRSSPGLDGIGVDVGDARGVPLARRAARADALAGDTPLSAMDLELGANDATSSITLLAQKLGARRRRLRARRQALVPLSHRRLHRVGRSRRGVAARSCAATRAGPRLSAAALRDGAVAGGRYLLRHLYDDGRFGYEYTPATDKDEAYGLDYSLPRHAGATYFLAQLFGATHDAAFRDGARRALDFLSSRQPDACGRPDRSCVANPDVAQRRSRRRRDGAPRRRRVRARHRRSRAKCRGRAASPRSCCSCKRTRRRLLPPLRFARRSPRREDARCSTSPARPPSRSPNSPRSSARSDAEHARYVAAARSRARLSDRHAVRALRRPVLLRRGPLDLHGRRRRLGRAAGRRIARSYARFCDRFVAFLRRTQFDAARRRRSRRSRTSSAPTASRRSCRRTRHRSAAAPRRTLSTYLHGPARGALPTVDEGRATREQIRARHAASSSTHQIRDDNAYSMANPDGGARRLPHERRQALHPHRFHAARLLGDAARGLPLMFNDIIRRREDLRDSAASTIRTRSSSARATARAAAARPSTTSARTIR